MTFSNDHSRVQKKTSSSKGRLIDRKHWPTLIADVQKPLQFFVLSALLIEAMIALSATALSGHDKFLALLVAAALLLLLIITVAGMSIWAPYTFGLQNSARITFSDAERKCERAARMLSLLAVQEVILWTRSGMFTPPMFLMSSVRHGIAECEDLFGTQIVYEQDETRILRRSKTLGQIISPVLRDRELLADIESVIVDQSLKLFMAVRSKGSTATDGEDESDTFILLFDLDRRVRHTIRDHLLSNLAAERAR